MFSARGLTAEEQTALDGLEHNINTFLGMSGMGGGDAETAAVNETRTAVDGSIINTASVLAGNDTRYCACKDESGAICGKSLFSAAYPSSSAFTTDNDDGETKYCVECTFVMINHHLSQGATPSGRCAEDQAAFSYRLDYNKWCLAECQRRCPPMEEEELVEFLNLARIVAAEEDAKEAAAAAAAALGK